MVSRNPLSQLLLVLSLGVYGVSLFDDGFYIQGENPRAWSPAICLLLIGWIGVLDGVIAWIANPLLLVGWVMLGCRLKYAAAIFAVAAILCIGSLQLCDTILVNENGGRSQITGYGGGYWLWLASAVILLLGSIAAVFEPRKQREASPSQNTN